MLINIYSRKSIYTEKGNSVENQIEICKEYIFKNIKGAKLEDIVIYEDEGFSGKNTNRPQFQKMIADSKKQKPDYIVCYRLDRISRSVSDFSSFVEDMNSRNISFICIGEQFDTSIPGGRAMIYMVSVFAQLERETLAERVRDNMFMLARTGIWLGGICPIGFSSERKTNVIIDGKIKQYSYLKENKDTPTVKLIFDLFLKFGSSMVVAKYLTKNGMKTANRKFFYDKSVRTILRNPVYCIADKDSFDYFKQKKSNIYFDKKDFHKGLGIMPFNRSYTSYKNRNPESEWIIALGKHKGIITGKDWVAVQNILDKNKPTSRIRKSSALISGLIKCQICGSNMNIKSENSKNMFYYICSRKKGLGIDNCNSKNLHGPKTDEYVINYIINFDEENLKKNLNIKKYSRKVNKFHDKIDEIKFEVEKLENEKNIYLNYLKKISPSSPLLKDIEMKVGNINNQIEKLEVQKQSYKSQFEFAENEKTDVEQILKNLSFFKKNFYTLNFDAKKSLLRLVLNKLTWNGSNLKILLNGQHDNF